MSHKNASIVLVGSFSHPFSLYPYINIIIVIVWVIAHKSIILLFFSFLLTFAGFFCVLYVDGKIFIFFENKPQKQKKELEVFHD